MVGHPGIQGVAEVVTVVVDLSEVVTVAVAAAIVVDTEAVAEVETTIV